MTLWSDVQGYRGLYLVSDEGDIRTVARKVLHNGRWGQTLMSMPEKDMRPILLRNGYLDIQLSKDGVKKHHLIHRLVAAAFIGPSALEVNHKDGVKKNNRVDNLEYCTSRENQLHVTRVLKKRIGEKNGMSKLTQAQVDEIRRDDRILRLIAADYGVTLQAIHLVKKGRNWADSA